MWVVDFLGQQLWMLAQSDVGGAPVEDLTTLTGLWVRNGIIHALAGVMFLLFDFARPRFRAVVGLPLAVAYVVLQVVQVFTAARPGLAIADGLLDVALPVAGYALALWLLSRATEGRA